VNTMHTNLAHKEPCSWPHRGNPHYHSFCPRCCHPASACCCSVPQCRKEAKEVVVVPEVKAAADKSTLEIHRMASMISSMQSTAETKAESADYAKTVNEANLARLNLGSATAFIGGGCCVHLSVEYMPADATASASGLVVVVVIDSEGTVLAWAKTVKAQSSYEIKENIITTNPGAKLIVYAINLMVRVRWCEVFSC
jgi:hypothetical protein